jgi:hypothetical protein
MDPFPCTWSFCTPTPQKISAVSSPPGRRISQPAPSSSPPQRPFCSMATCSPHGRRLWSASSHGRLGQERLELAPAAPVAHLPRRGQPPPTPTPFQLGASRSHGAIPSSPSSSSKQQPLQLLSMAPVLAPSSTQHTPCVAPFPPWP